MEKTSPKSSPSFRDRRSWNHAAMVPDRGFQKQLHVLDPDLEVVWDWFSEKWEIWRVPGNGDPAVHVMTVQTKNRSYRELGADVLLRLQMGDTKKFGVKQIADYLDEVNRQEKRRKAEALTRKVEAITWDNFDWMRGVLKVQVPKEYRIGEAAHA